MTLTAKRRTIMGAGLGFLAAVSAVSVFIDMPLTGQATAASQPAAPPAVPVTVSPAKSRDVRSWDEFSGRLEAVERVQIRPRVAGAVKAVHFREGALVKAGDLLVSIDPQPYEAAVAAADAQVASAQAKLALAKIELDRGQRLSDSRTISQSDFDQRQSSFTEAQANLRNAQATLRTAQLDLDYTNVLAPVAGRVGKIEVTVGNLVAAGSTSPALTTLVSVDPIYASFNASEEVVSKALASLPAGDGPLPALESIPVEIGTLADNGTPVKGKLQFIDNQVDAASGTIGVRAVFDNPAGKLIPGQFVRVRMGQPKEENRIMVSERAIGTDQDKKFVFVVDGDNKVVYRPVTLGIAVDGMRAIESGLSEGDKVIVNGLQRIRPGAVVAPQVEEKVATAK